MTMALIQFCCCWSSLLSGCYASAFYTMIYFTVTITMVTIFGVAENDHVADEFVTYPPPEDPETLKVLNISVVTLSSTGLGTTFLLLYGLAKKRRPLLVPWIVVMTCTTSVDLVYAVYLLAHVESINAISAAVFAGDFILVVVNAYCILCVFSQYQAFKENRHRSGQRQMLGLAVTDDLFDTNQLPVEQFKLSDLLGLPIDENNTPSGDGAVSGVELWIDCPPVDVRRAVQQQQQQQQQRRDTDDEPANVHAITVQVEPAVHHQQQQQQQQQQRRVTFESLTNNPPS